MGQTEAAGRPSRIASPPARSGRSRRADAATPDADARARLARAPLRDSDVDEVERELTDDDLQSPADPAERARVENARRRLDDRELLADLAAAGFTGLVFDVVANELAAYGIAVMMAWTRTGLIFRKCEAMGRPLSEYAPQWSWDDRLEIAIEATARGLRHFIDNVLKQGRWDHRRGATLKTFFVGACLQQFPNAFDVWLTEQRRWSQLHSEETTMDDAVGADPEWADPTGDAAVRKCAAHEYLAAIPDPRTRQAAWMVLGHGASHTEAGAAAGLSAAAVEGRLYRLLRRPQ